MLTDNKKEYGRPKSYDILEEDPDISIKEGWSGADPDISMKGGWWCRIWNVLNLMTY